MIAAHLAGIMPRDHRRVLQVLDPAICLFIKVYDFMHNINYNICLFIIIIIFFFHAHLP